MWKPKKLGNVIAERDFVLKRRGRRPVKVRVRFGRPVRSPTPERGDPWWCPVEIRGRGLTPVAGIDSLQALVLALHFVAERLPIQAAQAKGHIEWVGREEKLVFSRAFVSASLESALLILIGGIFRAVALLGDKPGRLRRERDRVVRGLRALGEEIGL